MKVFMTSILYYIAWFVCVFLASHGYPFWACLSHFLFGIYLWHDIEVRYKKRVFYFACLMMLIGFAVDHTLWYLQVIDFPPHALCWQMTPIWMTSLWFTLSIALLGPFKNVLNSLWVALIFGALGGPFSYVTGASQTQAMQVSESYIIVVPTLSIIWIGCMYLFFKIKAYIYKYL